MLPSLKVEIILPIKVKDKTHYKLLEPYIYRGIIVPVGFETDGATVPRIFWAIFPPVHRYFPAAVVHDYLLSVDHPRKEADWMFREALKELGISKFRTALMYYAVRMYSTMFA